MNGKIIVQLIRWLNLDLLRCRISGFFFFFYKCDVHRAVCRKIISIVKPTRYTNVSNLSYFGMTLCMFRTVFPPIIRSSWHTATGICQTDIASKQAAVSVWQMLVAVCIVLNSGWWTKDRPKHVDCLFSLLLRACFRVTQLLHQPLHIYKIYIKTLRHVSVLRPSSGSYIFLAKVTLEIVTD